MVRIYEVSPRDGLQNEQTVVDTSAKIELIERLVAAGLRDIEVTSFVRPSWIPQLSDAAEVVANLPRVEGVRYWGLVPNERGLERAIDAGIRHVATFMSVSETHNNKNVNRTRKESVSGLSRVIEAAKTEGLQVRSYLSTVFGCPYEGQIPVADSVRIGSQLLAAGADELALSDTIGTGNPRLVGEVVTAMTSAGVGLDRLALHLHDTRGTALANAYAGWLSGIRTFDGSIGGVGGCPYAPGASGNAATEDLVHLFEAMELGTGVDLEEAAEAGVFLSRALGRALPGRYHRYHVGACRQAECRSA